MSVPGEPDTGVPELEDTVAAQQQHQTNALVRPEAGLLSEGPVPLEEPLPEATCKGGAGAAASLQLTAAVLIAVCTNTPGLLCKLGESQEEGG